MPFDITKLPLSIASKLKSFLTNDTSVASQFIRPENINETIGTVAKDVGQSIARNIATVATIPMNPILKAGGQQPITNLPTKGSRIGEAVFGGKPIQSLPTRVAQFKQEHPKISGPSGVLATPFVIGGIAMDLAGGESKPLSKIADSGPVRDMVIDLLKKIDLSAIGLVKRDVITATGEVDNVVERLLSNNATTQDLKKGFEVIGRHGSPEIKKELDLFNRSQSDIPLTGKDIGFKEEPLSMLRRPWTKQPRADNGQYDFKPSSPLAQEVGK